MLTEAGEDPACACVHVSELTETDLELVSFWEIFAIPVWNTEVKELILEKPK